MGEKWEGVAIVAQIASTMVGLRHNPREGYARNIWGWVMFAEVAAKRALLGVSSI